MIISLLCLVAYLVPVLLHSAVDVANYFHGRIELAVPYYYARRYRRFIQDDVQMTNAGRWLFLYYLLLCLGAFLLGAAFLLTQHIVLGDPLRLGRVPTDFWAWQHSDWVAVVGTWTLMYVCFRICIGLGFPEHLYTKTFDSVPESESLGLGNEYELPALVRYLIVGRPRHAIEAAIENFRRFEEVVTFVFARQAGIILDEFGEQTATVQRRGQEAIDDHSHGSRKIVTDTPTRLSERVRANCNASGLGQLPEIASNSVKYLGFGNALRLVGNWAAVSEPLVEQRSAYRMQRAVPALRCTLTIGQTSESDCGLVDWSVDGGGLGLRASHSFNDPPTDVVTVRLEGDHGTRIQVRAAPRFVTGNFIGLGRFRFMDRARLSRLRRVLPQPVKSEPDADPD